MIGGGAPLFLRRILTSTPAAPMNGFSTAIHAGCCAFYVPSLLPMFSVRGIDSI